MSGKIPKALATSLKACKALLAAEDYGAALRCCLEALGTPAGETHYGLHIFAGAAAAGAAGGAGNGGNSAGNGGNGAGNGGDAAEAERFLRRAAELQPGEAAAWQGLEDLHARQHAAAAADASFDGAARQAAEDRWVDSLERLAGVTAKRRKIDVRLARVLQGSKVAARRAEAWRMWHALMATAKKEAQVKVPLEAAVGMVMASSGDGESRDAKGAKGASTDDGAAAAGATAGAGGGVGVGVGDSASRCAVLAKYLDFCVGAAESSDTAAAASESSSDTTLLAIVERYVCEKLQGLSAGMNAADHDELASLRAFVLSRAVSVAGMDALLRKESLVHGCGVAPIIFEACLLPLLMARGCDLCSQLDHVHVSVGGGYTAETPAASGGDKDLSSDFAKFLVDEYPDRPVAHLWYACRHGPSLLSSDAESALEHARLGMKGCGGEKTSKTRSTSTSTSAFAKAAGPVVMAVVTAVCRLRLSDLLLISPHGNILSGEGTTAPGSARSKVLQEIVSHAAAGLSAIAACTASTWAAESKGATGTASSMSPPPLLLVGMLQHALRVCKAMAMVRRAAPGHHGWAVATSVLSSMPPAAATPSDETIRDKLMSGATLCAVEADIQRGNFKEARKRGSDFISGECKGLVLAATTALLALADFCEEATSHAAAATTATATATSAEASIAGFERALAAFRAVKPSGCSSSDSPAAVHLSASLHFWLARAMWCSGNEEHRTNRKHCFENLIAAAKLKPEWGAPFGLLGQYYMKLPGKSNATRGEKCLERALTANPCLEDEGTLLATSILNCVAESQRVEMTQTRVSYRPIVVLTEDKDTASTIQRARTLYEGAIERSGGHAIWAWRGLGVMHTSIAVFESSPPESKSDRAQNTGIDVDGAIECFQSLLRHRPNDGDAWERLGHAYASASRYTAALKSFETVLTLAPGRPTALRGMAEVELAMGSLAECTSHLREALVSLGTEDIREVLGERCAEHEMVLCERSLAVSLLAQARIQLSSDMFSHARDSAAEGLAVARRVQRQRQGMVSPRKLVGDLHALLGALPASVLLLKRGPDTMGTQEEANLKEKQEEEKKQGFSESKEEIWRDGFAKKKAHLEAAVASFRSVLASQSEPAESGRLGALGKRKNIAAAWMDLGVGLFRLCQATRTNQAWKGRDDNDYDDDEEKGQQGANSEPSGDLVKEARTALKHAIFATRSGGGSGGSGGSDGAGGSTAGDLAAIAADAWNVLGVVETEMAWPPRPLVAQYAYVRAMSLSNGNHAHAWSNLGFLYLKCGCTKRALAAFMTSQSLAPASSIMWCGLGIISAGRGNEQKRALESYKCAMEYFPHLQAKLGMGRAAMQAGDYATAMGALQRSVDEDPCDASTRNALALALSQLGDADGAREEFGRAEMLLEFQRSEHANLQRDGGISRLNAALEQLRANHGDVRESSDAVGGARPPLVVELSQEILVERAAGLLEIDGEGAGQGQGQGESAGADAGGEAGGMPIADKAAQRAEKSIQMLLRLSETRWWNCLSSFSSQPALRDVTDVISGLWMQLARRLMLIESDRPSAAVQDLCLSCVRFAICVAGHGGSSSQITEGLICLGSLLQAQEASGKGGKGSSGAQKAGKEDEAGEEEKGSGGGGSMFAARAGVFLALAQRPRWINLPLATRRSCHGAATARAALTCAIRVDPSCQGAWDLLGKLP